MAAQYGIYNLKTKVMVHTNMDSQEEAYCFMDGCHSIGLPDPCDCVAVKYEGAVHWTREATGGNIIDIVEVLDK